MKTKIFIIAFEKKLISKLDEVMKSYISKRDIRSANAFFLLYKERVEFILQNIEKENLKDKSKRERKEIIEGYQKQVEESIITIKERVENLIMKEGQKPEYIGFLRHNPIGEDI